MTIDKKEIVKKVTLRALSLTGKDGNGPSAGAIMNRIEKNVAKDIKKRRKKELEKKSKKRNRKR